MALLVYAEIGFIYCLIIFGIGAIIQLLVYQLFNYSICSHVIKGLNKLDKKLEKIF